MGNSLEAVMLITIIMISFTLNVSGQNLYPSQFDRDFNIEEAVSHDPLANLNAYEQRFQDRVKERDNFYKNALRSSDNNYSYRPYRVSAMKQRPRDNYNANPVHYIGGMYNRGRPSDDGIRFGPLTSDSSTPSWLDRKAMYDELEEAEDRITRADQWEEFKEFATKLKEAAENNPTRDPINYLRAMLEWTRNLDKPKAPRFPKKLMKTYPDNVPKPTPSPGMAGYWGEDETASSGLNKLSPKEVREKALRLLQDADKMEKQNPSGDSLPALVNTPPTLQSNQSPQNVFHNFLPKEDDFKSPIRWVPLSSNDTRDGLARVTDPRTGTNRQYVINGTVLVPVIDYSEERLGLTSTAPPILTTTPSSLRTVVRNIDVKNLDQTDWLVFEAALDMRDRDNQCFGDGCQARCQQLGCDSMCKGDTCATGCIGGSCKTSCKGPGCMSMCIGTGCIATCDGMSCEARSCSNRATNRRVTHAKNQCRGNGCEATCRSFSCRFAINGQLRYGGGVWEEHYPQYRYNRPRENEYY